MQMRFDSWFSNTSITLLYTSLTILHSDFVAPDWPSSYTNQYVYTWDKSIHNIANETVPDWIRFRQNNYSNHCRKNDHHALYRDSLCNNTQELHLEYTRWFVIRIELLYSV